MASQSPDFASPAGAPFGAGHQFSSIPVLRPQAKLTVSQPDDPQEQEAEKTAAEVMRADNRPSEAEEEKERAEGPEGAGTAARQVMRDPAPAGPPPADPGTPPTNPATPTVNPNAPAGDPLNAGGAGGGSTTITLTPTTRPLSAPNLSQLWDVMTGSGTRESASVLPKFEPPPQYEYDVGNNVTKATLSVTETKEMPQWQELPSQCPPIANEWNRFYGVMDAHENRHLAIDKQHFTNLHTKLIGKPQAVAWKMVDDEIDAANKENDAYDASSNHGVNEGANINTAVQCAPEKVKSTLNDAGPTSDPTSDAPTTMQAKLTVNVPGDPAEQEADRMADRVLGMPAPRVQRACAGPGRCDCPTCRAEQEQRVARESRGDAAGLDDVSDVSPVVAEGLSGGGQPLDTATRALMEPRFGHDFSRVRVHADERASRSAEAVAARAYAVGGDLVFRQGEYAPGTADGDRLLAHELTHTIQQGQSPALVQRDHTSNDSIPPPRAPDTLPPTPDAPAAPTGPVPAGQYDGHLIATWGWLWKTKLTAEKRDPRDFDTLARASTYGASVAPVAVFQENARFVVYHLKYTALHSFTYENAKINTSGDTSCDMRAVEPVQAIITEDGVAIMPHQLVGKDGSTKDDLNSPMEAKDTAKPGDDPFATHKDVFGKGLGGITDRETFLKQFRVTMREVAISSLDRSQKDAEQKKKDMAAGALPAQDKAKIQDAAKRVAEVDVKIFQAKIPIVGRPMTKDGADALDRARALQQERVAGLEAEKNKILLDYPLLGSVDAADFLKMPEKDQAKALGDAAGDVLENITITRNNVMKDDLDLWGVPSLVNATQAGLGVDEERKKWVAEKVRDTKATGEAIQKALVVFQIAFSVAAVAVGGPVGAAFAVGALGVSMGDALLTTQKYAQDEAAAGTDIDKTKALVPDDLTGRWAGLVMAWVNVGLSFADAAYWVRSIKAETITADEAAAAISKNKGLDEGRLKAAAHLDKVPMDPEALRKTLLSALPEDVAAKVEGLTVQVLPEKDFVTRFGAGDASTVFTPAKDGAVTPVVFVKDTGNPLAIRAQAPNIEANAVANRYNRGPLIGPTAGGENIAPSLKAQKHIEIYKQLAPEVAAGTTVLVEEMVNARRLYMDWVRRDPGREVALWFHPETGDIAVVQGKGNWAGGSVPYPTSDSRWQIIEHFHPERNFAVQFASEADFRVLLGSEGVALDPAGRRLNAFDTATGKPLPNPVTKRLQSTIMYRNPTTGDFHYSYFGYDPALENSPVGPFFLNVETKGGARLDMSFRDFKEMQSQVDRLAPGVEVPQ